MDNLKSSFWGGVSYIGIMDGDAGRVLLRIAGHDVIVRKSDPGLKNLRVTSGSNKIFIIFKPSTTDSTVRRICGVLLHPTPKQVLSIQEHLREGTFTDRVFAGELPEYHYKPAKKT
jgi:hypothetical protein